MLRDLIPADLAKSQSINEWKRVIVQNYNGDAGKSYKQHVHSMVITRDFLRYNTDKQ